MSRGLTTDQNTRLASNPYIIERLVEIDIPDQNYYYYTTGTMEVEVETPTSGAARDFTPVNGIEIIGDVSELYEVTANEITISVGDTGDVVFAELIRANSNFDFARIKVYMYLLFRNAETYAPFTDDIINIYTGSVRKIDINRTESDVVINLRVTNDFANFDLTNGRSSSDFPDGIVTENINWGNLGV